MKKTTISGIILGLLLNSLAGCGGDSQGPTANETKLMADGEPCNAAWVSSTAYGGGGKVSRSGRNYTANWWTQGNDPVTSSGPAGSGQPWLAGYLCGGTTTTTKASTTTTKASTTTTKASTTTTGTGTTTTTKATTTTTVASSCPAYVAGTAYAAGKTVTNAGGYYTCTVAGWCSSGASAYEPGVGWAWSSAWSVASASVCGGTTTTTNATTTSTGTGTTTTTKTATTTTTTPTNVDTAFLVNTDAVLVNNFLGIGIQWDPTEFSYTDAQWNLITNRVDFMNVKFMRVMIGTGGGYPVYMSGIDANNNPVYNWNSTGMQKLYKILDYAQSHNAKVMLGEWNKPPFANGYSDPRWIKGIADALNHLRSKGYTCIQYYNFVNEPNGEWMHPGEPVDINLYWNEWSAGARALYNELSNRGYWNWVKIVGPDSAYADNWIEKSVAEIPDVMGQYEYHIYTNLDSEISGGSIETRIREKRNYITENDPNGANKHLWLGEMGNKDGIDQQYDSQMRVYNYDYGVVMADFAAQVIRGGGSAGVPWMLDDSMHMADATHLKVWGMWNTLGGTTIGGVYHPASEQNLRPWYYSMSLISKFFPQGGKTLEVASSKSVAGLRATAIRSPNGANWDLTVMIVNNSDTPRSAFVQVPNSLSASTTLRQYNYFVNDQPKDANGFPAMKMLRANNLTTGLQVDLPSRGVIYLTTLGGGTPVNLSVGGPAIGKTIYLRTKTSGRYVSALAGGVSPLQATAIAVGNAEKFTVVDAGNGTIALRSNANGSYVTAWKAGTHATLEARSAVVNDWERFTWTDQGNGYIALKAKANNKYVTARYSDTNVPLDAVTDVPNEWELFQWGQ